MWHFMDARNFVFQQIGVLQVARTAVNHFLGQDLSETHVAGTNDLSFDREGVQGFATIVGGPNIRAGNQAGLNIHINLGHIRRKRVCWSKSGCCTFVHTAHGG